MEGGIAAPRGMDYWPLLLPPSRIVGLEAEVKAQDEVVEVEAQAGAIGCCELAGDILEVKHSARLIGIGMDGPDIAGIDKEGSVEDPEELDAVFDREVEAYVATLVDEVGHGIAAVVGAGAEGADAPAADTVGAPGIEAFLEGHHARIGIRHRHTSAYMESERMTAPGEIARQGIVNLGLGILREGYAEDFIDTPAVGIAIGRAPAPGGYRD